MGALQHASPHLAVREDWLAQIQEEILEPAFKRLAAGASFDERTALFSGTATRVYRLQLAGHS